MTEKIGQAVKKLSAGDEDQRPPAISASSLAVFL